MKQNHVQLNRLLWHAKHFLEAQRTDYRTCVILKNKIMPLLDKYSICREWRKKMVFCRQQIDELEKRILDELKQTYADIKNRIMQADLFKEPSVKQYICILDSMLTFRLESQDAFERSVKKKSRYKEWICSLCEVPMQLHRPYVFPSYAYGIHEGLKNLCVAVVGLGEQDLLEKYVDTYSMEEYAPSRRYRCIDCKYVYDSKKIHAWGQAIEFDFLVEDWCCPDCGNGKENFLPIDVGSRDVTHIENFNLAPSMNEAVLMNEHLFLWDQHLTEDQARAAYEMLYAVEIALDINREFLRNTDLKYNSINLCKQSGRLLEFHAIRIDILAMKRKRRMSKVSCYSRDTIKKAVNVIIAQLGIMGDDNSMQPIMPLSIELIKTRSNLLLNPRLQLKVKYAEELYEIYDLHAFQGLDRDNNIKQFVIDLIENEGEFIDLDSDFLVGVNAKKYLRRVGFCGVLEELFIEYKGAHSACLRSTVIDLSIKPDIVRHKLCKFFDNLRTIDLITPASDEPKDEVEKAMYVLLEQRSAAIVYKKRCTKKLPQKNDSW